LEKNVLEKMAIWSKIREEAQTKRHSRAAEFKTQDYLDLDKLTLLNPAQPQNTQVLQPIPAQQMNFKMSSYDTMLTKNINISDFESDTSSPFDNMELKTINDLEELASVLKPTSAYNNTNIKNVQPSDINVSQYYPKPIYNNYLEHFSSNEFLHSPNINTNQTISSIHISNSNVFDDKNKTDLPPVTMPNILLQLEADLNSSKYNDESPVSVIYLKKLLLFTTYCTLSFRMIHKNLYHTLQQMGLNHLHVHFLIHTDHFLQLANVLLIKCIKWAFLYHVLHEHVNYLVKTNPRYVT